MTFNIWSRTCSVPNAFYFNSKKLMGCYLQDTELVGEGAEGIICIKDDMNLIQVSCTSCYINEVID